MPESPTEPDATASARRGFAARPRRLRAVGRPSDLFQGARRRARGRHRRSPGAVVAALPRLADRRRREAGRRFAPRLGSPQTLGILVADRAPDRRQLAALRLCGHQRPHPRGELRLLSQSARQRAARPLRAPGAAEPAAMDRGRDRRAPGFRCSPPARLASCGSASTCASPSRSTACCEGRRRRTRSPASAIETAILFPLAIALARVARSRPQPGAWARPHAKPACCCSPASSRRRRCCCSPRPPSGSLIRRSACCSSSPRRCSS